MFRFLFRNSGKGIPQSVLTALDAHSYESVICQLQCWSEVGESNFREDELIEAALSRGWNEGICTKIRIFANYYFKKYPRAFDLSREFLAHGKNFDADLFVMCVGILYTNNQFEDSAALLADVPETDPALMRRTDYWVLRALVLWAAGDMPGVDTAISRALEIDPDHREVLQNALSMYWEIGNRHKFDTVFARISALGFDSGYAYALTLLTMGRYREGFCEMEARYEIKEASRYLNKALLTLPRWNGVDPAKKGLLISAEQGLGDTIQMARYLTGLESRVTGPLTVEVQHEAMPLLEHNFPSITFVSREYGKLPPAQFGYWTGMMSLPMIFGTDLDSVPHRFAYIGAPSDSLVYWRARVTELTKPGSRKVGIAWAGQPAHRADRRRSIPFAEIGKYIESCDAHFFALQKMVPTIRPQNLIDVSSELVTLADTAALIHEMDLVVTVDTSVVHIAGAMGKRALLLLPFRYEWRWGLEGATNPWYESVTVCRQDRSGDWDSVLKDVFLNQIPSLEERAFNGVSI